MILPLTLLTVLTLGVTLPDEEDPFVRCTRCRNEGARPCCEHDLDPALEDEVLYCSVVGLHEDCGGTAWLECERCDNHGREARLEAKRAAAPARAAALAYLGKEMGRPLRLVETEHFLLVFELNRLKVGKKKLEGHELIHLYARRLEELFDAYVNLLGVPEEHFENKCRVMVWANEADHREASARYCGASAVGGVKLMGRDVTYSVPALRQLFNGDEALHRNLVHNVTHLLLSHQRPMHWMGQTKGGWADAGLAHWFEDRFFGRCDNYCYQEVDTRTDFPGGKWRVRTRKLVAADASPGLAALFQQNTDSLTYEQHMVSFSLVDYLTTLEGGALNKILVKLRQRVETREVLKEVLGIGPLQLDTCRHDDRRITRDVDRALRIACRQPR